MKKGSLLKKSALRLAIFGLVILVAVCVAAGWHFYNQNIDAYTDMAFSYVSLATSNIDSRKVNRLIERNEEIQEFYSGIDMNLLYDGLTEEDVGQVEDPELRELIIYWSDIEHMIYNTSMINPDIVYYYVMIPTEEDIIYIWDSDTSAGYLPPPFDHGPYSKGEKARMEKASKRDWEHKLLLYNEPEGVLGTAMTPILYEGEIIAFADVDISVTKIRSGFWRLMLSILIILILVMGISVTLYFMLVRRQVITPIEKLEKATSEMVESIKKGKDRAISIDVHTNDEIDMLARSFEDMDKEIISYIEENAAITAEKERLGTELSLAAQIQNGMLPSDFSEFSGRNEFEIYASMDPAKEVGGDFYDFFLRDEDHLIIVIADVSGKGVPAALFMMVMVIMIRIYMREGASPAEALKKINQTICKNNSSMFITVWLGELELSTGHLTAVDAGHEYPMIKSPDGEFELLADKHSFVVGGLEDAVYKEYELDLKAGSKMFLYTDGLKEATDKDNNMFGTDRMLEVLNRSADSSPEELIREVNKAVGEFVKDAPQFDDLTMLCISYKG